MSTEALLVGGALVVVGGDFLARPAEVAEFGAATGGADDAASEFEDPEAVRVQMVNFLGLLFCAVGLGIALLI